MSSVRTTLLWGVSAFFLFAGCNNSVSTKPFSDTDSDTDPAFDYYDDCLVECVGGGEFEAQTGFIEDIDIEFSDGRHSHRCADPESPYAVVEVFLPSSILAPDILNAAGVALTPGQIQGSLNTAISTWDQVVSAQLQLAAYDDVGVGGGSFDGSVNVISEDFYPGSDLYQLRARTTGGPFTVPDHLNVILTLYTAGGFGVDQDGDGQFDTIEYDDWAYTQTGGPNESSLDALITHELGHALGLGHLLAGSASTQNYMRQGINNPGVSSIWFRSTESEALLTYLYPVSNINQRRLAGGCP